MIRPLGGVILAVGILAGCTAGPEPVTPPPAKPTEPQPPKPNSQIQVLTGRLDLERYKTTIKGLTQFGDRRQGTERNRKAVDWIEAQLKSYGCTPTERITYTYKTPPPR